VIFFKAFLIAAIILAASPAILVCAVGWWLIQKIWNF
jgi:hypothetical protein